MNTSDNREFKKADLRSSVMKPIHAGWLIQAYESLKARVSDVRAGFLKAGITGVQTEEQHDGISE